MLGYISNWNHKKKQIERKTDQKEVNGKKLSYDLQCVVQKKRKQYTLPVHSDEEGKIRMRMVLSRSWIKFQKKKQTSAWVKSNQFIPWYSLMLQFMDSYQSFSVKMSSSLKLLNPNLDEHFVKTRKFHFNTIELKYR